MQAYNVAQQYAFNLANSFHLNYEPLGVLTDPVEELCPGEEGYFAPVDPCAQKLKLDDIASNTIISQKNYDVRAWMETTGFEYGYEQKVTAIDGTTYMNTGIRTDSVGNTFTLQFTWSASTGFAIGTVHTHPLGNAPSPIDVFNMLTYLTLVEGTDTGVEFYKKNASLTVIGSNNTYAVTVNNWVALKKAYDTYLLDPNAYNNRYRQIGIQNTSSEIALLTLLGNSINLFKMDGDNKFQPRVFDTNGALINKNCPN